MKKFSTRMLSLLLVLSLLVGSSMTAFAANTPRSNIGVMIDGQTILFSAAAPRIINGRTMVPFRRILESLGAQVTYDNATRIIGATLGNTSLSFKAGNANLTLRTADGAKNITMDVIPYLDAKLGSTFVSARFVAEAFGFSVDWDADQRTVIIIDMKKLLAPLSDGFSILSKLNGEKLSKTKTYQMLLSMDLLLSSANADMPISTQQKMTMTAFMRGMNLNMSGTQTISDSTDTDISTNYLFDAATMTMYMKNNALKDYNLVTASGKKIDKNTWIRMTAKDITAMYAQMGITLDFEKLLKDPDSMQISDLLNTFLAGNISLDCDSYASLSSTVTLIKSLFGDEAFTKKTSGAVTTYTLDSKTRPMISVLSSLIPGSTISYYISVSENAGKLTSSKVSINFKAQSGDKLVLNMTSSDPMHVTFVCDASFSGTTFAMDMTSSVSESNQSFSSTPSTGESIVDYADYMTALMSIDMPA